MLNIITNITCGANNKQVSIIDNKFIKFNCAVQNALTTALHAPLGLLLNRSPKFSRDFGFYGFAAEQNGFTPKLFITLTTTLTLTQARNNRIRV